MKNIYLNTFIYIWVIHLFICIYIENQSLMKDIVEQLKEHKDGDDKTTVIEFVIGDIVQVIGGELRCVYTYIYLYMYVCIYIDVYYHMFMYKHVDLYIKLLL
jgi:hypothetical protein